MENKTIEEQQSKQKPVSRKKTILSVVIVLMITAIVFIIFFNFNDFNETLELLKTVDGVHMAMAFLCLLGYAALWPLSLCFKIGRAHV